MIYSIRYPSSVSGTYTFKIYSVVSFDLRCLCAIYTFIELFTEVAIYHFSSKGWAYQVTNFITFRVNHYAGNG